MLVEVLNLVFWFAILIIFSYLLDLMWAYSLHRWIYIVFSAPGIIFHELSHWIACKLTGARVTRVRLISRTGGEVIHGPPRGGVFGQALISMAPLFGIPLFLVLIALLFSFLKLWDFPLPTDTPGDVGSMVVFVFTFSWDVIRENIFTSFSVFFLLYVYLAASMTTAMAPSKQDFKNSIIGIGILIAWTVVMEALFPDFWEFWVLRALFAYLGAVVVIGLIMCLFGLILGTPFMLYKYMKER